MPGAVRLVHDDLFNGPSDLIVLPCATGGSVTSFVAERMRQFTLPPVPAPMALGDVRIVPLTEAASVAQYVAYAASVKSQSSTPEAIREIGKELGRATKELNIRKVNCPLLGAGAGHLRSEKVFDELSQGFKEESEAGSVLRIFVLHEAVYTRLVEHAGVSRTGPARTESATLSQDRQSLTIGHVRPRVFMSYTRVTECSINRQITQSGTALRTAKLAAGRSGLPYAIEQGRYPVIVVACAQFWAAPVLARDNSPAQ